MKKYEVVYKNLLDSDAQVLCHQVNCMGVMGSGVAKEIKKRWPDVYKEYRKTVETLNHNCLGGCLMVPIENGSRAIANLFGQYYYFGYFKDPTEYLRQEVWKQPEFDSCCNPKRFTNYEAFWKSLQRLREEIPEGITKIAFPYNIGCCRGGGNWEVCEKMIQETFRDIDIEIEICRI